MNWAGSEDAEVPYISLAEKDLPFESKRAAEFLKEAGVLHMQVYRIIQTSAVIAMLLGFSVTGQALESPDEEKSILQIGIWNPVQLCSEQVSVNGLRLNIPYGANLDLMGYSLGIVNENLRDNNGIELGFLNYSGRDVLGFQIGLVNAAGRELNTVQLGLYNLAEVSGGFQAGLVNWTRLNKGLQLGVINFACEVTGGAQIGLLNLSHERVWKVLPIIRWVW